MFTGLIADLGRVRALTRDDAGARIEIDTRLAQDLSTGDSIAVDGYTLDGGTSTEMVARLPGHPNKLTLETAPHGNRQRPIPVGIGVRYSG